MPQHQQSAAQKHVHGVSELLVRLKQKGMAAFEEGQPGEGNLAGDQQGVLWWIDGVGAPVADLNRNPDGGEGREVAVVAAPEQRAGPVLPLDRQAGGTLKSLGMVPASTGVRGAFSRLSSSAAAGR